MDLKKNFRTDEKLENEGVWVPMDDKTSIKVARMGNRKYREALNKKLAPYKVAVRQGILPEDTAQKVLTEALVEAVLLDWKGLEEAGEPVEYTQANATRLLNAYPDFRSFVEAAAEQVELFKLQEKEEAVKN